MSKIKIFSLGGLNENGKNMYVVEVDKDIFVFDAGLKYADDKMLGVDYIIPNYDYLKQHESRIKGIFITHAHNEQMGALSDIIPELPNTKIYGTEFTIDILKKDLEEDKIKTDKLVIIKPHKNILFGSNGIFPISLSHSVPEAVGYVLNTKDGAIVYTGNFVFDPTMSDVYKTDIGKLAYIGKQGVLCLMSESKYAANIGYTSPGHRINKVISETLYKYEKRILFNVFDGQIYRIQEIFNEILNTNRKVIIMGKRLESIINEAIDKNYIKFDKSRFSSIHNAKDENVIILISDDREKPFSNLDRIIKGYDKFITLKEDDTVVFASSVYPGIEKTATRIYDNVSRLGCNLVILSADKYLSLHASSEDLMMMIDLMNPKYYFPVIGEYKDQVANANVAKKVGISEDNILLRLNGQVIALNDGNLVETHEVVTNDDVFIDGKTVGDVGELVIKDREILSENGVVIVSVTIDKNTKELIAGPEIYTRGFVFVKESIDLIKEAEKRAKEIIINNTRPTYIDFGKVKMGIRDVLGKYFYDETECKPMILLTISEI